MGEHRWLERLFRLLVVGVWERRGGRSAVGTLSDGCLEAGDELGNMRLVEVLDGVSEFVPFLAVAQQFYYLLTTFDVLRFRLSYPAFLLLSLVSDRAERILRPFALVFLLRLLGLEVPGPALVVRKVLPGHTDDLGERAMVRLDLGGDVLTFDKRRTEEDERVGRARDIA